MAFNEDIYRTAIKTLVEQVCEMVREDYPEEDKLELIDSVDDYVAGAFDDIQEEANVKFGESK